MVEWVKESKWSIYIELMLILPLVEFAIISIFSVFYAAIICIISWPIVLLFVQRLLKKVVEPS